MRNLIINRRTSNLNERLYWQDNILNTMQKLMLEDHMHGY